MYILQELQFAKDKGRVSAVLKREIFSICHWFFITILIWKVLQIFLVSRHEKNEDGVGVERF